ncbi:hypothetical protein AX16_005608 [Volvariella volvacea WC 439]|nr:hypothetical protein AX16_005608 [Volvariella volvacea WC 439]
MLFSALVLVISFAPLVLGTTLIFNSANPALSFPRHWRMARSLSGDSFLYTSNLGLVLTVKLPDSVTSISYLGYRRARGSIYGFCIDCANSSPVSFVDGHDPDIADNTQAVLSTMFVIDLDATARHNLSLYNLPDPQFGNTSELTLHSLVVNLASNNPPLSDVPMDVGNAFFPGIPQPEPWPNITSLGTLVPNTPSPSPTTTSSSSSRLTPTYVTMTETVTAPFSARNSKDSSNNNPQVWQSLVALIVVACLIAAMSLGTAGYIIYYNRQKRLQTSPVSSEFFSDDPGSFWSAPNSAKRYGFVAARPSMRRMPTFSEPTPTLTRLPPQAIVKGSGRIDPRVFLQDDSPHRH